MKTRGVTRAKSDARKASSAWLMRRNPTPAEALLWEHLRADKLGGLHFRRQQMIDSFIADFYCAAAGLIVEVDGSIHEEMGESDAYRDGVLVQRDVVTLRVTNAEIEQNITAVIRRIYTVAKSRMAPAAVPSATRSDLATEASVHHESPSPSGEGARG